MRHGSLVWRGVKVVLIVTQSSWQAYSVHMWSSFEEIVTDLCQARNSLNLYIYLFTHVFCLVFFYFDYSEIIARLHI